MQKNLFISNFKKLPGALLITVFLVIFAETANFFIYKYCYIYPDRPRKVLQGLFARVKNNISKIPNQNFDILVFGDSYSNYGISPDIIEGKTGLSCFNFATNGENSAYYSFCIFDNYLKANSRKPKFVIIGFMLSVASTKKPNSEFVYEFSDMSNIDLLIREFGVAQTLKYFVPTLRNQYFIADIIKNPGLIFNISNNKQRYFEETYKILLRNKGLVKCEEQKQFIEDQQRKEYLKYFKFSKSSKSLEYLKKILEYDEKNKINTVLVLTTNPKCVLDSTLQKGEIAEYKKFLYALQKEFPHLVIEDPQNFMNDKDFYSDEVHLNLKGEILLSSLLADKITQLKSQ